MKFLRDDGDVVVVHELEFLVAVVEDLEEEHPDELGEALGVAVYACVFAHDVLDGFYGRSKRHGGEIVVYGGCATRGD